MRIENSIIVFVPMDIAWSVTENVEDWPLWTPTMEKVHKTSVSDVCVGSEVLIKQPQLPETTWTIVALEKGNIFSWSAKVRGMNITAIHKLRELDGCIENTLIIEVQGILPMLLWPLMRGKFNQALTQENIGFKDYCERMCK